MEKLTLKDLSLAGQRVLMRVDFNVPLQEGNISDDTRIRACLESIEYVLERRASLILMSHLGRPKNGVDFSFSLAPCAKRLSELLKKPVQMAKDCVGPAVEKQAEVLQPGQILLLENLRFHVGEENPEKEPKFVEQLAKLGTCYVNDAFGTAHRAHTSTALIARYFPGKAAMGFLMEKEIQALKPLLTNPPRPYYALIGGAKVSTKIGILKKLLEKVDCLFLGGAMVYTFMKARGLSVGDSKAEDPALLPDASPKLRFPLDLVIADRFASDAKQKVVLLEEGIPPGWQGMDIGPKTVNAWAKELTQAKTLFWNGPLGVFEMPPFAKGTRAIAKALAHSPSTKTIVGGGDSVAAIEQMGLAKSFAHLSTGGGASLEYLEYGHLPGIDALSIPK